VNVTLWFNGWEVIAYRFPKIKPRFSSPLLSYANLHLCGAWPWSPRPGRALLDVDAATIARVLRGTKPVGYAAVPTAARLEVIERRARVRDVAISELEFPFPRGYRTIGLAQPGAFGDTFDLDALEQDYRAYLAEGPATRVAEVAQRIRGLAEKPLAATLPTLVGDPHSNADLVECGLSYGYPVETTAAILARRIGIPDSGVSSRR